MLSINWSLKASPTKAWKIGPSFQRFAVKTSKTLQDLSIKAEQTKQEVAEQIKEASKNFDAFKRQ